MLSGISSKYKKISWGVVESVGEGRERWVFFPLTTMRAGISCFPPIVSRGFTGLFFNTNMDDSDDE